MILRTESSQGVRRKGRARDSYRQALLAAAVAALLSACTQVGTGPAETSPVAKTHVAESDMPEIVIVASRVEPESIG